MITPEDIEKGFKKLNIIWIAMLMCLIIYLFIGLQVADKLAISFEARAFSMLRIALYAIAVMTAVITGFVKKLLISSKGMATQGASHPLVEKYSVAMIISWALADSIGIYGLVLYFIGKEVMDLYLLIGTSAAAMVYYRPKKEEMVELVKANAKNMD